MSKNYSGIISRTMHFRPDPMKPPRAGCVYRGTHVRFGSWLRDNARGQTGLLSIRPRASKMPEARTLERHGCSITRTAACPARRRRTPPRIARGSGPAPAGSRAWSRRSPDASRRASDRRTPRSPIADEGIVDERNSAGQLDAALSSNEPTRLPSLIPRAFKCVPHELLIIIRQLRWPEVEG